MNTQRINSKKQNTVENAFHPVWVKLDELKKKDPAAAKEAAIWIFRETLKEFDKINRMDIH